MCKDCYFYDLNSVFLSSYVLARVRIGQVGKMGVMSAIQKRTNYGF